MSEPIQSISQGNYILQGTVATSAGIVGDGSTQNPLRADETVLWSGNNFIESGTTAQLNDDIFNYKQVKICYNPIYTRGQEFLFNVETSAQSYRFGTFSQDSNVYNTIVSVQLQGTEFFIGRARGIMYNTTNNTWSVRTPVSTGAYAEGVYKIIGINRISANNA